MAPAQNDDVDWSDSDEEDLDQVETNVLLGVPDGTVDVDHDKIDAAVSRIGGLPVRESCIYSPARIHIDLYLSRETRHSCPPVYLHFLRRIVRNVRSLWNFSSRCGVHSRTVPWTEHCTSGAAPGQDVKAKMAGGSIQSHFHGQATCGAARATRFEVDL